MQPWFDELTLHVTSVLHRKQNYELDVNGCDICVVFCLLDVTSIDMNVAETVLYVTWHQ